MNNEDIRKVMEAIHKLEKEFILYREQSRSDYETLLRTLDKNGLTSRVKKLEETIEGILRDNAAFVGKLEGKQFVFKIWWAMTVLGVGVLGGIAAILVKVFA